MEKRQLGMQKHAHIFLGLAIAFGILAIALVIILIAASYSQKNTRTNEEESDKASFYLGASFSGFKGMVNLAYSDGLISEEEYTKLEELEEKAIRLDSDTLQAKDILNYMEYAMKLEGINEYFKQDGDNGYLDFNEGKMYQVETLSFTEGFAVYASRINLKIWHDNGSISDKEYRTLYEKYKSIYKNPTHQGCEEYITEFNEILLKVLEEEMRQAESNTQQNGNPSLAVPYFFRIIGQIYCFFNKIIIK